MVAFLPQSVIDVEFQQPWWNFREVKHRADSRDSQNRPFPYRGKHKASPAWYCPLRFVREVSFCSVSAPVAWSSQSLTDGPPVTRGVVSGHRWIDCREQLPAAGIQLHPSKSPVTLPLSVPQAYSCPWPSPKHSGYPEFHVFMPSWRGVPLVPCGLHCVPGAGDHLCGVHHGAKPQLYGSGSLRILPLELVGVLPAYAGHPSNPRQLGCKERSLSGARTSPLLFSLQEEPASHLLSPGCPTSFLSGWATVGDGKMCQQVQPQPVLFLACLAGC